MSMVASGSPKPTIVAPSLRVASEVPNIVATCWNCEEEVECVVWCTRCDPKGAVVSLCQDCHEGLHSSKKGRAHKPTPHSEPKPMPREFETFTNDVLGGLEDDFNMFEQELDSLFDAPKPKKRQEEKIHLPSSVHHVDDSPKATTGKSILDGLLADAGFGSLSSPEEKKVQDGALTKKLGARRKLKRRQSISSMIDSLVMEDSGPKTEILRAGSNSAESALKAKLEKRRKQKEVEAKKRMDRIASSSPKYSRRAAPGALSPARGEEKSSGSTGGYVFEFDPSDPKQLAASEPLKFGPETIVCVSSGTSHCAAVSESGLLFMWGANRDGQLGTGRGEASLDSPTLIVLPTQGSGAQTGRAFQKARVVSCGARHTACGTTSGAVYTWGCGMYGVLGHGSDEDSDMPKLVEGLPERREIISLACGQFNTGVVLQRKARGFVSDVYTWGANESGQVGDGTVGPAMRPVAIEGKVFGGASQAICISFGNRHAAVCTQDGKVYTWGGNRFGQLGYETKGAQGSGSDSDDDDDESAKQLRPRLVASLANKHKQVVIQVVCGERHTSALTNEGGLWGWGSGETHQIGVFDNVDQYYPVRAKTLTDAGHLCTSISVGRSFSCCVTVKGEVLTWGFSTGSPIPKLVQGIDHEFWRSAQVSGDGELLVLSGESQEVVLWPIEDPEDEGDNEQKNEEKNDPFVMEEFRGRRVVKMSGNLHTLAVTSTGEVWGWGENSDAQLGLGHERFEPHPVRIPLKVQITAICAAECHSLALSTNGRVFSWGSGEQGRLGLGHDKDVRSPQPVIGLDGAAPIRRIAAGKFNSGAVDRKGALYLWGAGNNRQLGFKGRKNPRLLDTHMKPVHVQTLGGKSVLRCAIGSRHVVVATKDGEVWSWGGNQFGQLGYEDDEDDDEDEDGEEDESACAGPRRVDFGRCKDAFARVYADHDISFAITDGGRLFGWGTGETHQLANPDEFYDAYIPEEVEFSTSESSKEKVVIKRLDIAGTNCVAFDAQGRVWGWGWDLGERPTILKAVATYKGGSKRVDHVACSAHEVYFTAK